MPATFRPSRRPNALPIGRDNRVFYEDYILIARKVFDRDRVVRIDTLAETAKCSRESAKRVLYKGTINGDLIHKAINHYVFPEDS